MQAAALSITGSSSTSTVMQARVHQMELQLNDLQAVCKAKDVDLLDAQQQLRALQVQVGHEQQQKALQAQVDEEQQQRGARQSILGHEQDHRETMQGLLREEQQQRGALQAQVGQEQ